MPTDRGNCPYYLYTRFGEPFGTCNSGCWEEPACETDEPQEGWPSANARDDAAAAKETTGG